MAKFLSLLSPVLAAAACALSLCACSPTFDWREVHGAGVPFSILLPAKPTSSSRQINLDGEQVSMTMTASEADGTLFAVGCAELPDAAKAARALTAMKTALARNFGGVIRRETASSAGTVPATIEIEAVGAPGGNAQPRLLIARFIAVDRRVYQLVVVGKEKAAARDAADTFLSSFKPA